MRIVFENFTLTIVLISLVCVCQVSEAGLSEKESEDALEAFYDLYLYSIGQGSAVSKEEMRNKFAEDVATMLTDTDPESFGVKPDTITLKHKPTLSQNDQIDKEDGIRVVYFPLSAIDTDSLKKTIFIKRGFIIDEVFGKYDTVGMAAGLYQNQQKYGALSWFFLVVSVVMPTPQDRNDASTLQLQVLLKLDLPEERNDRVNFEVDDLIWKTVTRLANQRSAETKNSIGLSVIFDHEDQSKVLERLVIAVQEEFSFEGTERVAISVARCQERLYSNGTWTLGKLHVFVAATARPAGIDKSTTEAVLADLALIYPKLGIYNDLATEIAEYMSENIHLETFNSIQTVNVAVGAKAYILSDPGEWLVTDCLRDSSSRKSLFQEQFNNQFPNDERKKEIIGSGIDLKVVRHKLGHIVYQQLIIIVVHVEEIGRTSWKWEPNRNNSNAQAMVLVGEWVRHLPATYADVAYTEIARNKMILPDDVKITNLTKRPDSKFLAMAVDYFGNLFYIQCKKSSPYVL